MFFKVRKMSPITCLDYVAEMNMTAGYTKYTSGDAGIIGPDSDWDVAGGSIRRIKKN